MVKRLPTVWETWVQSLGQEDLLEKEMATHRSILAWKIPWMEKPGGLQSMWSQRVRHDWATPLSNEQKLGWKALYHSPREHVPVKDRNSMDLTEAEGIKKRWQDTQKNYTNKDLNDLDNHDGMITDLEPNILECEVKWALGSITTNKASGDDELPAKIFQILKDDAVKSMLHSVCQ